MKKYLTLSLLTVMVAIALLLFTACGTNTQGGTGHIHAFAVKSTTATCTTEGAVTYVCECGETYTVNVPTLGHDFVKNSAVAATCTEAGSVCYECSRCHEQSCETVPALGHAYTVKTTEATCTENGSRVYTCTRCGDSYTEVIPAVGHSYAVTTTEADCGETGLRVYTCTRCGDSYTETIPALGHSYTVTVKAATCTKTGSRVYTCSHCGDGYTEVIPAIGHSYTVKTTEPTCTKTGSRVYTCVHCGDKYTETIPVVGHDYRLADFCNASCEEDGYVHYVCADCEAEKTEILPHLGHDWEVVESIAATCEEGGYDVCECARCHASDLQNETEKLGHLFVFPEGDYVRLVKCERENCTVCARRASENTCAEAFEYCFDEDMKNEIDAFYNTVTEAIGQLAPYDAQRDGYVAGSAKALAVEAFLQDYYYPLLERLDQVLTQESVAYLNYDFTKGEDGWDEEYGKIADYKDDLKARFFAAVKKMYDSEYREYIFTLENQWTEQDIQDMLNRAEATKNERYLELSARANEIEIESRKDGADFNALYIEFIGIKNEIAELFGYDNYMDYAYKEIYDRDYTPDDVAKMRNFVKQYLGGSAWMELELAYEFQSGKLGEEAYELFLTLDDGSIFTDPVACNLFVDYCEHLSELAEGTGIDFYAMLNEAFKTGVLFTGEFDEAYTNYLDVDYLPYMYFGPGYYSSTFTFVHEFGHYVGFEKLKLKTLNYDFAETQSQGNEMLFLAYLAPRLTEAGYKDVFDTLLLKNLADSAALVSLATCVDEFEQIVYTLEYDGSNTAVLAILADNTIEADELQDLYSALLDEYDYSGFLSPDYWTYAAIKSPGYYISYAMSLIPSVTVYLDAAEDFETGADEYISLFDFDGREDLYDGELHETVGTYEEILDYAGISSPFTESTYQNLHGLFAQSVRAYRSVINIYLNYYHITSTLAG